MACVGLSGHSSAQVGPHLGKRIAFAALPAHLQAIVRADLTADPLPQIAAIAKQHLNLDTLETRNSDSLDFHALAVWSVRDALLAAFHAGSASTSAANRPIA